MAWIQVHQSLPTHRKTLAAAAILGVSGVQMVGHLVTFWLWCLDNAPMGQLGETPNAVIASAALWPGEPDVFVSTLCSTRLLDGAPGNLAIHNWPQYGGKLVESRTRDAARQRAFRERARPPVSDGALPLRNGYVTGTSRARVEESRLSTPKESIDKQQSEGEDTPRARSHARITSAAALLALFSPTEMMNIKTRFNGTDLEWEAAKCVEWHSAKTKGGLRNGKLGFRNWLDHCKQREVRDRGVGGVGKPYQFTNAGDAGPDESHETPASDDAGGSAV